MNEAQNEAGAPSLQQVSLWHANHLIFHQLNWAPLPQQWTCLLGQSGVGKSSLLRLMAGLYSKQTRVEGKIERHKEIAYLGQDEALLPWLSVLDNALLAARLGSYRKFEQIRLKQRALALLEAVGLGAVLNHLPKTLSGGMRQRLALVRALVEDKPLILMDEPFSHLDAITRYQLQNLAAQLLRGKTVVLVTHDPQEALRLADRIDLMSGCPAHIKTLLSFSTPGPRAVNEPEFLNQHQYLYQVLSEYYQ